MLDEKLNSLIVKFLDGVATEQESKVVNDWYASFDTKQGLTEQMTEEEIQAAVNQSFASFKSSVFDKS